MFADCFKALLLLWVIFVIYISCLSVILSCPFVSVLFSPAGNRTADNLYEVFSCVLSLSFSLMVS